VHAGQRADHHAARCKNPFLPAAWGDAEGVRRCEAVCSAPNASACVGFTYYQGVSATHGLRRCCFRTGSVANKQRCEEGEACSARCYEKSNRTVVAAAAAAAVDGLPAHHSSLRLITRPAADESDDAQCEAQIITLSAIYGKLNGDLWTNQKDWLLTTAECGCDWWGVFCEGQQLGDFNVTNLQLSDNDCSGFLPAMELIRLKRITRVALNGNEIEGTIPDEMGQLPELEELDLSWNRLVGPIPKKLGALARLRQLLLYPNGLTGTLPPSLGDLSRLQHLYADRNHLDGDIPPSFGGLHALMELSLWGNNLSSVPATRVEFSHLTTLALQSNNISGPLDPALEALALQVNKSRPATQGCMLHALGGRQSQLAAIPCTAQSPAGLARFVARRANRCSPMDPFVHSAIHSAAGLRSSKIPSCSVPPPPAAAPCAASSRSSVLVSGYMHACILICRIHACMHTSGHACIQACM
jgi:hypothetical protein